MTTSIITAIVSALIGAIGMWLAYGRTSKATLMSSDKVNRANTKNTYIAQYNNLFERVNKLEDEKDQDNKDMENSLQDRVALFFSIKSLILLLKEHDINIPNETVRVVKNYGNKLKQDSRNSL